jgi:hypothetical protein
MSWRSEWDSCSAVCVAEAAACETDSLGHFDQNYPVRPVPGEAAGLRQERWRYQPLCQKGVYASTVRLAQVKQCFVLGRTLSKGSEAWQICRIGASGKLYANKCQRHSKEATNVDPIRFVCGRNAVVTEESRRGCRRTRKRTGPNLRGPQRIVERDELGKYDGEEKAPKFNADKGIKPRKIKHNDCRVRNRRKGRSQLLLDTKLPFFSPTRNS